MIKNSSAKLRILNVQELLSGNQHKLQCVRQAFFLQTCPLVSLLCILFNHQKVSKHYEHDCLQNFLSLFMPLLTALIVKTVIFCLEFSFSPVKQGTLCIP